MLKNAGLLTNPAFVFAEFADQIDSDRFFSWTIPIMRNIELKCRYDNLSRAVKICRGLGAVHRETIRQKDIFFQSPNERLKLRTIAGREAELIWYSRANQTGFRESEYHIFRTEDAAGIEKVLTASLGIRGIVEKERAVYIFENVRIHLDSVRSLGLFLEFEAVIPEAESCEASQMRLEMLQKAFGISGKDCIGGAYIDLLETGG